MKKKTWIIGGIVVLVLAITIGGLYAFKNTKVMMGSEVYSFPEPTMQITGSFYSQGQETAFTIGPEKYDPNDLSTIPVMSWFYALELTVCDEPEEAEGTESYTFKADGKDAFTYEDRGSEAYIIVSDTWYKVNNPSAPPIDFSNKNTKVMMGSEVYSFPEPTMQITGSFYSQGQETAFTIGPEKYDPNDLSTIPVMSWFYALELTVCDEPEEAEGTESYTFKADGKDAFTYEDRGSEAYIIVSDTWYKVNNPSAPPIDFSNVPSTENTEPDA